MQSKSSFFALFFGVLILLVVSCGTLGTTSSSSDDLFVVKENSKNDIEGTIYEKDMQIYKISPTTNHLWGLSVYFSKSTREDITANMLGVVYLGEDWRFYDNIQIKIDDTLFSFDIENPSRNVVGRNATEIGNALLSQEAIEVLKTCTSIIVQVNGKNKGEPLTIDKNGMETINAFFMTTE
jgi:hypothetical protein